MIERLIGAHDLLCSALDNYIKTCIDAEQFCLDRTVPRGVLQELTNTVLDELAFISSYHERLVKAKAVLHSARNLSAHDVPISRLPTDVLIQVFKIITDEYNHSENNQANVSNCSKSKYPRLLTCVSSHWRRVAMAANGLWSCIKIPSYPIGDKMVLTRIEEHIARSGSCPLDVRIIGPQIEDRAGHRSIAQLLLPISSRIRSFELRLRKPRPFMAFGAPVSRICYSSILNNLFANSKAGTLTRLSISLEGIFAGPEHYFLVSSSSFGAPQSNFQDPTSNIISISRSEQVLEDLLAPVTSLELKGCYPRWGSKAYHGLVELRLGEGASISETELRTILLSSPKLRLLEFGLKITHFSPPDCRVIPAPLDDLETLVIATKNLAELGQFLRLIHPGSCQLSVFLGKVYRYIRPGAPANLLPIPEFFTRANLRTLTIASDYNPTQVTRLLKLVSHTRVLILSGASLGRVNPDRYNAANRVDIDSRVDDLYVLHETKISRDFLVWLIQAFRIESLILSRGSMLTHRDGVTRDKRPLTYNLSRLGCAFKLVASDASYPVRGWNEQRL